MIHWVDWLIEASAGLRESIRNLLSRVGLVQGGLHPKSQLNKCDVSKEDDQTIKNFEFSNMFIVDEAWILKFTIHVYHAHEKFGESKACACQG